MTKANNANKPWSPQESELNKLLRQDTPTRLMAYKLGRTPGAVQSHVNSTGRSTKPVNQSPYNRHKK